MNSDGNNREGFAVGDRVWVCRRGKKGNWTADFFDGTTHSRKSLKTQNKSVATARATELAAKLVTGDYHQAAPLTTIEDAWQTYVAWLRSQNRAKRTLTRYTGELSTFAAYAASHGITRLARVTMDFMDQYRAERAKDHDPATVYHETVVIKQLFRWARKRGKINQNPLADYECHKPPRKHKDVLILDQVNAMLAQSTPRRRAELGTLVMTGMRVGELQGLHRKNVDLKGGWIAIVDQVEGLTKTKTARKVPIHPRLLKLLRELPRHEHELFFTSLPSARYPQGARPINTKRLCDYFKAAAKRASVQDGFTTHSLRHFFKSFTVNNNVPERAVDQWLGHSDSSVRATYYHLTDAESKRFMNSVPFGGGDSQASETDQPSDTLVGRPS